MVAVDSGVEVSAGAGVAVGATVSVGAASGVSVGMGWGVSVGAGWVGTGESVASGVDAGGALNVLRLKEQWAS